MNAQQITNHTQQALARLMQQYKNLPYMIALITALVDQIQDLENSIYSLDQGQQIFNGTTYPAVGAQLDGLGQIIGLTRNGLSDQEYLVLLLGTIAENNSDSTASALLTIVLTVFQGMASFIKDPNSVTDPNGCGSAWIAFGASDSQLPASLEPIAQQIIQNSIGAGIKLIYLTTFSSSGVFACAGPQAWVRGFGAYSYAPDPSIGGGFAKLVFSNPVN